MLLLHKQLYLIWKEIAIKLIYIHEQIWMAVYPCSITHLTDQGFIMVNPFLTEPFHGFTGISRQVQVGDSKYFRQFSSSH